MNIRPLAFLILIFLGFSINSFAQNIDLIGQLKYKEELSSIWGYTSPEGKEYALVGTVNGTSIVNISIPAQPKEIHYIKGPSGYWREIKTWKNYAYIVHDNSSTEIGVTIVDLSNIDTSIQTFNFKGPNNNLYRAHTLFISEKGYLYLFGGSKSGAVIFNLNYNPTKPEYLGFTSNEYIHDGFIQNDTLWASNVYEGYISVWDVKDPSFPTKITQFYTPGRFTHNSWLSDNGQTLFTTDEKNATTVAAFDISDLTDIKLLDEFKIRPDEQSIPHNVHVLNDYLVLSHYTEGVVIADASDPSNIVLAGHYDTSPKFSGGGFYGCWGIYPYFKSELIIASDIETGLYILQPHYKRASKWKGIIYDSQTLLPINQAKVSISDSEYIYTTNFDGDYKIGTIETGTIQLKVIADQYQEKILTFEINTDSNIVHDIYMDAIPTNIRNNENLIHIFQVNQASISFQLREKSPNAQVLLYNSQGQLVDNKKIENALDHTIYWSFLPSGIYFIQIQTPENCITKKVYKN
ncbi:MAG TPA: choice-of-anchor B family protein [Chitinophagales bacterium]|nr:choice-of-anchor B family protein [Chitinophagales bacterium]